uniref:Uncharacterized protein n=1 Tax=Physcomitrium patens TaxID=3218 RepID=A0A2K1KP42_PHYPA|nr:hypothetical protein PHYPA_006449 [Physcomitrium patens]
MSQLGTPMVQCTDKNILVTLMYSKTSQQILFVEAGKEFVDLVLGFLTLPIGRVIKLLSDNSLITPKAVGGIANVFNSIQRLEAEETLCTNKMMLVDLKPVHGLGHLATEDEIRRSREGTSEPNNSEQSFFLCGASSHCAFVSPTHLQILGFAEETECGEHEHLHTFNNRYTWQQLFSTLLGRKVLQLLRASLTSVNVMSEVFGKSLGETCVITTNQVNLPSTPSQYKTFSSEEEKSEQAPQHNPDTAFHSGSLVNYEKEREHRISCVLRDLSYPASSVTSHSSRSSSTSVGTKQTIRSNGDHTMPGPCKEMLMLEKQVDKLMARVCHLTSLDHPPKPRSAPPTVKPPWITHHSTSRVRIPPRVWHL